MVAAAPPRTHLSHREEEIVALIAEGRTNKEIAATLILSGNTVKTHLVRIMAKAGCRNRTAIAAWWLAGHPAPPPAPVPTPAPAPAVPVLQRSVALMDAAHAMAVASAALERASKGA